MLSRQFLSWAEHAPAGDRADAARAVAQAFLYADLDRLERGEMERTMTCLLDDGSALVRRALAEALAGAAHAPHHLVSALANDQPDIAAVVLGRSPLLTDAELIDAAAVGEAAVQSAVARRPGLSAGVSGALAEVGSRDAVLALCRNDGATLAEVSARRILERFGADGAVREALGARYGVSAALRHDLVLATGEALRRFVTGCGWLAPDRARRVVGEAGDRAAVALAAGDAAIEADLSRFAAHLRRAGQLTPALVLRMLMSGEAALFEAVLAELSGQPRARVAGLVRRPDGLAFAALVRSAGLPDALLPVMCTALDAHRPATAEAAFSCRRDMLASVLARFGDDGGSNVTGLIALLRRLEAEAARDASRVALRVAPAPTPPPAAGVGRRIEPRFTPVLDLAAA